MTKRSILGDPKVPKNVKCNCGHTSKDHYQGHGWCHSSGHSKEGQCGCTWFYPNDEWISNNNKSKIERLEIGLKTEITLSRKLKKDIKIIEGEIKKCQKRMLRYNRELNKSKKWYISGKVNIK